MTTTSSIFIDDLDETEDFSKLKLSTAVKKIRKAIKKKLQKTK